MTAVPEAVDKVFRFSCSVIYRLQRFLYTVFFHISIVALTYCSICMKGRRNILHACTNMKLSGWETVSSSVLFFELSVMKYIFPSHITVTGILTVR